MLERRTQHHAQISRTDPITPEILQKAKEIVDDVKDRGEAALREHAVRLGDLAELDPLIIDNTHLIDALDQLPKSEVELLERVKNRIETFAIAQRESLRGVRVDVPGGYAEQEISPIHRAGCYAPGGRFPLPSSVLMTAVTARVAGVSSVWVASPRPSVITLAAAAIAGADALIAAGGAQVIAAMAYGTERIPAADVVVGPGSVWVTAAKQLIAGHVRIDMLAGPSELVVIADDNANPAIVAADLLAQAEHDPSALPILITTSSAVADGVDAALESQLQELSTGPTARLALKNGFSVVVDSIDAAADVANRIAPEHLELMVEDADVVAAKLRHYGALFVGEGSAEVLGDYGAGPNHVLPTGGTARFIGGLSVFTFSRIRTRLTVEDAASARPILEDARDLARLEGLEAHARSASIRFPKS